MMQPPAEALRPHRRGGGHHGRFSVVFVGTFPRSLHPYGIIPSSHAPHKIVVERRRRPRRALG